MEWLIVLVLLVAVVLLIRGNQQRRLQEVKREEVETSELASVRRLTEEDVAALAADLDNLDRDLDSRPLDPGAAADRQRAHDALTMARESLALIQTPGEVRNVTTIIADGRYSIACVRARVAGEPLPPRRPPCFFDPRHGPSVRDVAWQPDGGEPRDVPVCALDAERIEAGSEPHARQVLVGSRRVPYWEAGAGYAPWVAGYFAAFGILNAIFLGTMMGAMLGGFGDPGDGGGGGDSAGDADAGAGEDAGGSDGTVDQAGGDVGGGEFGAGDFGGGDFGGGDFGGF